MAIEIDIFNPPKPIEEVVFEKVATPDPFFFVNNVNTKKGGYQEDITGYVPFLVNRSLSFQKSNVLYANEMNMNAELTSEQQYDYYFYKIPKGNPWGSWKKFKITPEQNAIMKAYKYSYFKAVEAERLLTKEQIKEILSSQET